jgi:hypothetical protein
MGTRTSQRRFTRRLTKGTAIAFCLCGVGVLLAACGTGVATPGVASVGSGTTTTQASASQSGSSASQYSNGLAYAQCMRSHGVPNFPDPKANGSIQLGSGIDPSSPSFASAQSRCQKFLPGGGFPASGTTTSPTAAALAQMLKVALCMRAHGISQFPDPTTKVPSKSAGVDTGGGEVSDRDGVILVFPGSLDMQSAQFIRAATVCKFARSNH